MRVLIPKGDGDFCWELSTDWVELTEDIRMRSVYQNNLGALIEADCEDMRPRWVPHGVAITVGDLALVCELSESPRRLLVRRLIDPYDHRPSES